MFIDSPEKIRRLLSSVVEQSAQQERHRTQRFKETEPCSLLALLSRACSMFLFSSLFFVFFWWWLFFPGVRCFAGVDENQAKNTERVIPPHPTVDVRWSAYFRVTGSSLEITQARHQCKGWAPATFDGLNIFSGDRLLA